VDETVLLDGITVNPAIFGGKPKIRGLRLAAEHGLGMLASAHTHETTLAGYPGLETEDLRACLIYSPRLVAHVRVKPGQSLLRVEDRHGPRWVARRPSLGCLCPLGRCCEHTIVTWIAYQ
jgi:uncharacterized protein (DUF433 family)